LPGGLYSALLFGVHPADLPTIAGVIALVSLAAVAAAYIPSAPRRAGRSSLCPALRMTRAAGRASADSLPFLKSKGGSRNRFAAHRF
jgi:hypothetical protein